jgi:hypothetical protein
MEFVEEGRGDCKRFVEELKNKMTGRRVGQLNRFSRAVNRRTALAFLTAVWRAFFDLRARRDGAHR